MKRFGKYERGESISSREWIHILCTFVLVTIGWVIFRSPDIQTASHYIVKLFTITDYGTPNINSKRLFVILECTMAIVFVTIMELRHKTDNVVLSFRTKYAAVNYMGYLTVAAWAILFYAVGQTFIYFQF